MTDFGGALRTAREARGVTLRQIADTTKISVAALEALERNDVSKLPGGIFSRAFVRSYAAEVGLDPEKTVREFLERFDNEPAPEPHVHVPVSDVEQSFENRQRVAMLAVKGLLGLVIMAGVVGFFVVKGRRAAESASASSAPVSAAALVPAAATPAVTAPTAAPQPPPPTPGTGPMRVEVHPTSACWVRLVVDGQTVLSRVMNAGERQTVTVREAVAIDVGDAAAFAYTVDGRPGKVLGRSGQVTSVKLTRANLSEHLR